MPCIVQVSPSFPRTQLPKFLEDRRACVCARHPQRLFQFVVAVVWAQTPKGSSKAPCTARDRASRRFALTSPPNFPSFWKIGGLAFVHVTRRCCFSLLLRSRAPELECHAWSMRRCSCVCLQAAPKLRQAKSRQARALKRQASCLLRVDAFFLSLLNASKRQASCLYKLPLREMVLGKSRQAHQRTIMHSNTRQAANNHAHEHSTGCERVDAYAFGLREMVLGKSRQAHQRTQSLLPSATHRHSSITRPCCSSAQAPRRACNQHE